MRLAFSTNAFKRHTLEEAIDAIAHAGYAGVEIMADRPHAFPADMPPQRIESVRRRLADRALAVSNINAFTLFAAGDTYHPTWIEESAQDRRRRVEHTLACVELAAAFGARTISLQPGGPLIGTSLSAQQAMERFAEGLAAVLPAARACDVILAIEPEPGLLIQDSTEYLTFKNRHFRDEPRVRMNCDVGHLFCVGEDPAWVIRSLRGQFVHVHLEDIGANRVHQHLAPGKGVIDFPAIFQALREADYRGWATVELYPYEASAADVARMAIERLGPLAA